MLDFDLHYTLSVDVSDLINKKSQNDLQDLSLILLKNKYENIFYPLPNNSLHYLLTGDNIIDGFAKDSNNNILSNVLLKLYSRDSFLDMTTTEPNGYYKFTNLRPANYYIVAFDNTKQFDNIITNINIE